VVIVVARVVVGGIVALRVVTVVALGLEDVDNVLWGIVEVALEGLVPGVPEVTLGEVVVEVLEVVLEVVVSGTPEVTPNVVVPEVPEVFGDTGEAVVLVKDDPGTGNVEDATTVMEVPAEEGEDELGCGALVVVADDDPIVETEFGIVLSDVGC
jgi:hypothetical protein